LFAIHKDFCLEVIDVVKQLSELAYKIQTSDCSRLEKKTTRQVIYLSCGR